MAQDMFHPRLPDYLTSLVPHREPVMAEMEQYATETKFPIIGAAAGYYLYQLARMIGARRIFELGSGFGYSTAWFARAVRENGGGTVYHVVWDDDLSARARDYLGRLDLAGSVEFIVGEATAALEKTPGPFDMLFNDIDKHLYPGSLALCKERLRPGGILAVDNMLWHGAIFDEANRTADTLGVHETTRLLTSDPDFITTLAPIRDGVIVAYKQPASP